MNKEDLKSLGVNTEVGAVIGALIGLGLSFTALSPLVIGGIIGCAFYAANVIGIVRWSLYDLQVSHRPLRVIPKPAAVMVGATLSAAAVGVALGIGADFLFPDIMSNAWLAILAGAIIGAVGTMSASLVKGYIVEPIVEKVIECFSKEAPV